jgi:drug/metabolite transporter (DMT)-like permease
MANRKQKLLIPIIALVIANILWGLNTVFLVVSLETIPPALNVSTRMVLASLILLPFAMKSWKRLKKSDLLRFVLASVFAVTLSGLAMNIALETASAFSSAAIWLLSPVFLLVLSASVLKEKINPRTFVGVAVAILGSFIIIGRPVGGLGSDAVMVGSLLILLSVLFDCIGILLAKPLMKKVSPYQATFLCLFPGAVPVLLYALVKLENWSIGDVSRASAVAFALSTMAIVIANLLFYYALKHKQAHKTGIYGYLDPAFTVIAAWFILNERPNIGFVVGTSLIVIGIYLAELHKKHRRHHFSKHHLHL